MELLQNKLRPTNLKDVLGQTHLIGKDKILTNLVKAKKLFNIIFYGQSGIGKTTIALALMNEFSLRYRMLNATVNSKKDFEVVIEEAKMYNGIILIVDEIHRMNKDKQDILLSYIESGLITLIGLTNSNPYHSINPAIRSRCQLLELKPLNEKDVEKGLKRVQTVYPDIKMDQKTIKYIAKLSNGDVRYAYNLIEFSYYGFNKNVTIENIKEVNNSPSFFTDKGEDGHYEMLSAFQKSIRGSDVDAALHYLGRLIVSGDYESIYRRMTVIAYEDIGLANPSIGPKVAAAIQACERIGYPELQIPLSVIVTEMALSPKSNSAYSAMAAAISDINAGNVGRIPEHIVNGNPNYKYPHNYPNYWVEQQYLPDKLKDRKYYTPRKNKFETEMYKFNQSLKNNK